MTNTKALIEQAYSAFNKRNIDGALALMTEDVSWPKASEGGRVQGKEEIRAYWTRQWGEKAMFYRTAKLSTYLLRTAVSSQPWTSGTRRIEPPVRPPLSRVDPSRLKVRLSMPES